MTKLNNLKGIISENKGRSIIIILGIILIITMLIINSQNNNKLSSKKTKNIDYVYTSNEKDETTKCPTINLKSKEIDEINKEILEIYFEVAKTKYSTFNYKYSVNNNILSLLITIVDREDKKGVEEKEFISYNIDIESLKILSNNEVLEKYDLYQIKIDNIVNETLEKDYELQKENKYIEPAECDFECYLTIYDVYEIEEIISYYINEHNKVEGYLNFELKTIYFDENHYKEIPYKYIFN